MSTTAQVPPAGQPAEPVEAPAGRRSAGSIEPLLRRLHFYAGVFVAPFLLLAALTGLAYTIVPQLDQLAYGDQVHVAAVGSSTVPLTAQVAAAQALVPGGTVTSVSPPGEPDATTKVVFAAPDLPAERSLTVHVDPYTGQVRGQIVTWFGATPIAAWLDQMHRSLNLGDIGALYTEFAASWLWVLVLGGLVLWWRRQRGARRLRRMARPESSGPGVRRTRGLHASTGVWIGAVLLILSATGLTWSTYAGARFDLVQEAFDSTPLAPRTALPTAGDHSGHTGGGTGAAPGVSELDDVLTAARDAGLDGPVEITPAAEPGQAWTVAQTDNRWPVRRDVIAVDPATGTVVDHVHWADQPPLAKLATLGVQAHMGLLFGPVNQIVLAVTALGLIAMILWGYRMWWQRRPTRTDRRRPLGTPPARGTWRHLPRPVLVVGIPVVLALGWAMPVLGVSLIGFLLLDAVLGLLNRGRTTEPA